MSRGGRGGGASIATAFEQVRSTGSEGGSGRDSESASGSGKCGLRRVTGVARRDPMGVERGSVRNRFRRQPSESTARCSHSHEDLLGEA